MKDIKTLIPDVYELVQRKDGWFTDELSQDYANRLGRTLQESMGGPPRPPSLRLSKMGPMCPKALWHSINTPEEAEPLPPWAEIKYSFGHMIEALAITLAKAAGHEVEGEQDVIELDGILGHRDCVIDGCTVDVKSSSSRALGKYKTQSFEQDDPFGYLDQLDGYVVGSLNDPVVRCKDKGYIWAIDKQLGHMVLYEHPIRSDSIKQRIVRFKEIVGLGQPPLCTCETVQDGKSGNIRLGVKASYSPYKFCCFPRLRIFLYADGPKYLTHVERKPDVIEVDKHGKFVYN